MPFGLKCLENAVIGIFWMEKDRGELKMIRWMKKGRDTCFFADHIQVARAMGREGCRDSFEK